MKKEYIFAGITIIFWATSPSVVKLLLQDIPHFEALAMGSFIAFLFLTIINSITKRISILKKFKLKDYITLAGLGTLGLFFYSALYYYGLSLIPVQDACTLNYLWPIMVVIFSCIILKEKMTAANLTAVILSFIGAFLITTKGDFHHFNITEIKGILSCIFAAIAYGLFSVLNKQRNYPQAISMMIYFFVTSVLSSFFSITTEIYTPITPIQWLGFLWIGIGVDAIAYTLWGLALNNTKSANISNFAYITPVLAMFLSCIIFNEPVNIWSVLGLCCILLGILIQFLPASFRLNQ